VLQALQKQGVQLRDRFEQDWEILMVAGHGGIGISMCLPVIDAARPVVCNAQRQVAGSGGCGVRLFT